jgi:two-component system, OmpR family, phosphate regulon response regulator PhoB
MSAKVLIVEDESAIRKMVRFALELESFAVVEVGRGVDVIRSLEEHQPELILLDWMLPSMSGLEVAKMIRQHKHYSALPIIMLTAKVDEHSKVAALEAGADDYISKPFSPPELIARIRAVLRRGPRLNSTAGLQQVGGIKIDAAAQAVMIDDILVTMGRLEYRLLHFFVSNQNRVYSRQQLLNHVWGVDKFLDERTVDVHVRRLRKRLSLAGYDRYIQTVHGSGYRFVATG